jgi:hypothetical protein
MCRENKDEPVKALKTISCFLNFVLALGSSEVQVLQRFRFFSCFWQNGCAGVRGAVLLQMALEVFRHLLPTAPKGNQ